MWLLSRVIFDNGGGVGVGRRVWGLTNNDGGVGGGQKIDNASKVLETTTDAAAEEDELENLDENRGVGGG